MSNDPDLITISLKGLSPRLKRKALDAALKTAGYSGATRAYYLHSLSKKIDMMDALSFKKIS